MIKECQGRFTKREAIDLKGNGIAGLTYNPEDKDIKPLKVNLELLKNGLAAYLRNYTANEVILISFDEIEYISFLKPPDIILNRKSLFHSLLKWNIPYPYAKIALLEQHILVEYDAELIIKVHNTQPIIFKAIRRDPMLIADFLYKLPETVTKEIAIHYYELQD